MGDEDGEVFAVGQLQRPLPHLGVGGEGGDRDAGQLVDEVSSWLRWRVVMGRRGARSLGSRRPALLRRRGLL